MSKVTVYRIENHKNHRGMYNCQPEKSLFDCPFYSGMQRERKLHPRPEEDTMLRTQLIKLGLYDKWAELGGMPDFMCWSDKAEKYIYGFANIDQMKMWLHDHKVVEWLADNGFVVTQFEVKPENVLIGQTQAMFIRPGSHDVKDIREVFGI